jgi:hypothetical protein
VDYKKSNNILVKNKFPLPIIDEIAGAKHFTTIDLASGFHHIRMVIEDKAKTSFKIHHGHFQLRVMSFGLTNTPATFQCLMNAIFGKCMRRFVLVFMDNILVFSKSLQEHVDHLRTSFPDFARQQIACQLHQMYLCTTTALLFGSHYSLAWCLY